MKHSGLLEAVEKSAEIYLKVAGLQTKQMITDEQLKLLAETFKLDYKKEFLS
jgi:ribulose-5-phosphate 4-epimerase/fuculose-1-phosphate aldolase